MKASWATLMPSIEGCTLCGLHEKRRHAVPGEGSLTAPLMVIGEGPGGQEDEQGRPFVGAAGQLLDKMLGAIGIARQSVYIANIVKCRPPGNRAPLPEEIATCLPYLRAQVALVRPRVILCLGATAAQTVIGPHIRITRDRGTWHESKGVWLLPTFHPAALLRDASKKKESWADMQALRAKLDELHLYLPATANEETASPDAAQSNR